MATTLGQEQVDVSEPTADTATPRGRGAQGRFRRHVSSRSEHGELHAARAANWFDSAIRLWERDGRISEGEANTLRERLNEPLFLAVLPHFGEHLAIGVAMRFPVGSITRATYTLVHLLMATLRLLLRRIDRSAWGRARRIHSPLVILCAAMPGIGTFAYLTSGPIRTNPLLLRIGLDSALMKLPFRLYERTGLRWLITRPDRVSAAAIAARQRPLGVRITAQTVAVVLGLVAGAIFAADVALQTFTAMTGPEIPGWDQLVRLFDLNAEASIGTWFQVATLTLLAGLLAVIAYAAHARGERFARHWFALAIVVLGLSIDEQAKIHDSGGFAEYRDALELPAFLHHTWIVLGLASVLVIALIYRRFVLALPSATRSLFVVGAGFYIAGEILIEGISSWYISGVAQQDLIYQTITSFEELLGMGGIWFAITATLHHLQTRSGEVRLELTPREYALATRANSRTERPVTECEETGADERIEEQAPALASRTAWFQVTADDTAHVSQN